MACWTPFLTSYIVVRMLQLLSLTCFLHVLSYGAFKGPLSFIPYQALYFPPTFSEAPLDSSRLPSFSQLPRAIVDLSSLAVP